MISRQLFFWLIFVGLNISVLNADEVALSDENDAPPSQERSVSEISEAFGHLIGRNIEAIGIPLDLESLIKGLQAAAEGREAPMNENECMQAIYAAQDSAYQKAAVENLKVAEEFLEKNKLQKDIVSLEEGKVQYRIEKKGHGQTVQINFSPLVRYVGKYLDGSIFMASKEDEPLPLDETIQGLSKGMIGMREGEKRTFYIHPDLAQGIYGQIPPNSMLTFELEIVKANHVQEKEEEVHPSYSNLKSNHEIALPESPMQGLR